MTGYELAQFFDQSAAWVWSAPHSNIYPELRRLEGEGLLSSSTEIRGEKLERRLYEITDEGVTDLLNWAVSDPSPSYLRDPLFVRVGFLDLADPIAARSMLSSFIEQQKDLITHWVTHVEQLRAFEAPLLVTRLEHRPRALHHLVVELKANAFLGLIDVAHARIACAQRSLDAINDIG